MLTLEILAPGTASYSDLRALAQHLETIRSERMPGDPPLDTEDIIADLQRSDPANDRHYLLLWENAQIIARATITLPRVHHLDQIELELTVLAAYRRQGLARRLLREVVRLAEQSGRHLLLTNASSRLPDGEAVLRHLGAQMVMEQQFMELDLRSLDPQLLVDWVREFAEAAPEYLTWFHLGSYPQERLTDIAQIYDVMQTAPQGIRNVAAVKTTPQELQLQDEQLLRTGRQRLTTFAEHRRSGTLVAFTELFWDVKRPMVMVQHGTAVQPQHRLHSLGRWIKATNLLAAQRLSPDVRFIRAGNTDDNTGMLRINHALGFRTYLVHTDWHLEVSDLRTYLDR